MYIVYDVNNDVRYNFNALSPYDAMEKMLYFLNIKRKDKMAEIKETMYGFLLSHSGFEYWIKK